LMLLRRRKLRYQYSVNIDGIVGFCDNQVLIQEPINSFVLFRKRAAHEPSPPII
jgi:hypothetical protein